MTEPRKPKRENYIECPECSAAAGEVVIYHTSALQQSEEIFDEGETTCPKGHALKLPAA